MIIDDVNDQSQRKASPARTPTPTPPFQHEPLLQLPPPYFSYQAIPPPTLAPRRKPSKRRRWRPKVLVLASFALNCLLLILWMRLRRRVQEAEPVHKEVEDVPAPKKPARRIAVVPDPHLGRCVQSANWSTASRLPPDEPFPFESETSFQFSDPSSLMFLLSQGAHSEGHLNIVSSLDPLPHALVKVRYHSSHVQTRANVCWMNRTGDGFGIGIFTPLPFDGQTSEDRLEYNITLFLPAAPTNGASSLPTYNLETNLPSFTHTMDSLRGVVEFDRLVLQSQNKPIIVQSLYAKNATIRSSNGYISGTFDASKYLSVVTTNAPIDATVNLHSKNIFGTTELVLQTRNAQLESAVSLLTSAATGEGGKFDVKAETSDGPLVMTFPASPPHSTLNFDAQTFNSAANVWLNHAFEGDFTLASNMIFVDRRPFFDPKKLRSVFYSPTQNGIVTGNVRWKMPIFKSKALGKVRVATTNNILKLYV